MEIDASLYNAIQVSKIFSKNIPCSVFVILGCINKAEDNKRKTFRFVLNNAVEFVVCPCLQEIDKNTFGVNFFFHVKTDGR